MLYKKILIVFYTIYTCAILVLLSLPNSWFPDFYRPGFMAGISTLSIFLVALPGWIYTSCCDIEKRRVLERFQVAIAFSMFLNGIGGLGLYKLYHFGVPYDKIVHCIVPAVLVIFAVQFADVRYGFPRTKIVLAIAALVLIGSVGWEFWELGQDKLFGTKTAGIYGQDYVSDTIGDLVSDVGGVALGVVLTLRRFKMIKRVR